MTEPRIANDDPNTLPFASQRTFFGCFNLLVEG